MSSGLLDTITVWDAAAARHILSRTLFGYTQADITAALSVPMDQFIDEVLLADTPAPAAPGTWVTELPDYANGSLNTTRKNELAVWWMELMRNQGTSFREKMALFMHNHFTTEFSVVKIPQFLYAQNVLFRQHAFGNFKQLTKLITTDAAMLNYLDGVKNTKTRPNENYSRELLELFTIGIGNYTETDVQQGARALTGWRVNGLTPYFTATLFDGGIKTYLGQSGNFNHEQIIDIIFTKDATAVYLCRELCKEFIHYEPDETYVAELAVLLRAANYTLKPVLAALLKSAYFHTTDLRGAKIKSPAEFITGTIRKCMIASPDTTYLRTSIDSLQQILFDPPDVRGWEGQRLWISTNTYPLRNQFTDSVITGKKYNGQQLSFKISAVPFARTFASSENAVQLVADMAAYFCEYPVSNERKTMLLETLLDGTAVSNWSTYDPQADTRLRNFYKVLLRLPEYQLS